MKVARRLSQSKPVMVVGLFGIKFGRSLRQAQGTKVAHRQRYLKVARRLSQSKPVMVFGIIDIKFGRCLRQAQGTKMARRLSQSKPVMVCCSVSSSAAPFDKLRERRWHTGRGI